MMTERKLFTAELQRLKAQSDKAGMALPVAVGVSDDLMKILQEIRDDIKELRAIVIPQDEESSPEADEEAEQLQQRLAEVSMLKTELRALAVCIEQTKHEIAALRPRDSEEDRLIAVTYELDAIVTATEGATQGILDAAEKVETLAREIQSQNVDGYVGRLAEDISETIMSVFEACNFQDITGQRITKVVKTLQYVEERVNAMIDIWGHDSIAAIMPKQEDSHVDDDARLLNGPALENQGISQDDIDKLFA